MRPSLELTVAVTDSAGTSYRWDPNDAPGNRPLGLSFRTKLGEGFSDAGLTLSRRVDQDFPDVALLNDVTVVGAGGDVAYEGRVSAMPRELGDSHSVGVTTAGYMAHTSDRKMQEIYVDRDVGAWTPASRGRKINRLTGNVNLFDPESTTDIVDQTAGVAVAIPGPWASPFLPQSESWYDAGPNLLIGKIGYSWKREGTTITTSDVNWFWGMTVSDDDKGTTTQGTANLRAAGPSLLQTFTPTAWYRYAFIQFWYAVTGAGTSGGRYAVDFYKLAVYGTHGLTTYTGEAGEPEGVLASDVVKDVVRRWCPLLSTDGVVDTNYVIQHLAFKEPTDPYDVLLEVNKYHLWHLGVWEDRTLHFRPYDFSDYQWEVRTDDPGTTFNFEGPSIGTIFNGIIVTYEDLLTGTKNVLLPSDFSQLRDESIDNPWNQAGYPSWTTVDLSFPTLQSQALEIGRMVLADRIRPKRPSSITVQGHLKDRQGNWQQAWKVRAGDLVVITNYPGDEPRLVHETSYDNESKTLTMSLDAPASTIDALFDRITGALTAKGLGI